MLHMCNECSQELFILNSGKQNTHQCETEGVTFLDQRSTNAVTLKKKKAPQEQYNASHPVNQTCPPAVSGSQRQTTFTSH